MSTEKSHEEFVNEKLVNGNDDSVNNISNAEQGSLPAPVSSPSKPRYKISTAAIIPIWIALSSSVIIYNYYLYETLQFRFPVFLVTWHLFFSVCIVLFVETKP